MSDQTIITLAGMVVGFFTLWLKLRYAGVQAKTAADKADTAAASAGKAARKAEVTAARVEEKSTVLENKLDDNTAKTEQVITQTNGVMASLQKRVVQLNEMVAGQASELKDAHDQIAALAQQILTLERYSHDSKHEFAGVLNTLVQQNRHLIEVQKLVTEKLGIALP